jgi:hypothetical protein
MMNRKTFIDLGFCQNTKHGQNICGDVFKYAKIDEEQRIVSVLSDGLGSGIKANIQAAMTASMALQFATENMEMLRSAEIIMQALPVCKVRNISYATFTLVDTNINGHTRIVEMGNPPFILIRDRENIKIPCREVIIKKWKKRDLRFYDFEMKLNDRLVFFSDGITEAGTGSKNYPQGWQFTGCRDYLQRTITIKPEISAHELAGSVIREALRKENNYAAYDDMTCAALYFRKPRRMLVFTGPPYERERDTEYAKFFNGFEGEKIIAGGTSSEIISRELGKPIAFETATMNHALPPSSHMDGVDLVCEGLLTLTHAAELLENKRIKERHSPAGRMIEIFMRNDIINFMVGTRINDALQSPGMTRKLDFRRNLVQRIAKALEDDYLKQINIEYV